MAKAKQMKATKRKRKNDILLGAIADDIAGATDLCDILVGQGMRTVLEIGVPRKGQTVRDADAVAKTFAAVEQALGPVDVLVNNAGTSQMGAFETITDEVWQSDLELKLFAAIRLSRLAFPGMKTRKWGRIINVLNTGAKAPPAGGAPTSVSRAAGMALTKVLSKEGAPHNVLVNALCTGLLESDQHLQRFKRENTGQSWEDFKAEMGKRVPLGRIGDALEFANMACFLASDAGSFISGTAINVDGGMCAVM